MKQDFRLQDIDELLQEVAYAVEANSFEQMCLYERYHNRCEWESKCDGIGKMIGKVGGLPVWISITFIKINGTPILVWDLTSLVADYRLSDKFLDELPKLTKKSDAGGFYNLIKDLV